MYDDLDRLKREQITLGGQLKERVYTYDANGNVEEYIDRNGRETHYIVDELNRVYKEEWLDSQSAVVHRIETLWDNASQVRTANDVTDLVFVSFDYDDLGRVTQSFNGGVTLDHAYDVSGNRTSLQTTVGATQDLDNTYEYDALNRLTSITQEKLGASGPAVNDKRVEFSYNLASQFHSITRFSDLAGLPANEAATSEFGYDGIGRLTDLTHSHDGSLITDYDWTFDAASRIADMTIDRPGTSADEYSDYGYNQNDELTSADHTGITLPDEQLEYDLNGNRTQGTYAAGEYNRLTTDANGNTYTYDAEGNIIRKVAVGGAVTVFSWDYRNRLVAVDEFANATDADNDSNATSRVEHTYDAFDRWVKTSHDSDGDGAGTADVTKFAYDGTQIIYQLDDSGNIENRYTWGPAVDMLLADEQIDGANVDTFWALTDQLGSVRELVDDDGNVELRRQFDSFGDVAETLNPNGVDVLFAFTGRPLDEATGLQNNWRRWYFTDIGRWGSEDPIGFAAGDDNLARYVGNQSPRFVDPNGLEWFPWIRGRQLDEKLEAHRKRNEQYLEGKTKRKHAPTGEVEFANLDNTEERWDNSGKTLTSRDSAVHGYTERRKREIIATNIQAHACDFAADVMEEVIWELITFGAGLGVKATVTVVKPAFLSFRSSKIVVSVGDKSKEITGAVLDKLLAHKRKTNKNATIDDVAEDIRTRLSGITIGSSDRFWGPGRKMIDLPVTRQSRNNTCVGSSLDMLLPSRKSTNVDSYDLKSGGLNAGDAISFIADNLDDAGMAVKRGSIQDALRSGKRFIAFVDNGHAVVVEGVREIDGVRHVIVRDPAVGAYLERLDWFVEQRAISNDPLLKHPAIWGQ